MIQNKTFMVEFETDNGAMGHGVMSGATIEDVVEMMHQKHPFLIVTGIRETTTRIL